MSTIVREISEGMSSPLQSRHLKLQHRGPNSPDITLASLGLVGIRIAHNEMIVTFGRAICGVPLKIQGS